MNRNEQIHLEVHVDEGDEKLGPPTPKLLGHYWVNARLHVNDVVDVEGKRYWVYRTEFELAPHFLMRAYTKAEPRP